MNTRSLQKLNQIKHHSPLWMVVILLLVGFSGCSQSNTAPNAGYGGQTPPSNAGGIPAPPEANAGGIPAPGANTPPSSSNAKPPEKAAEKPAEKPKDPSAIALAEEILKNAKNPFLSKLPKIEPIVKIPDLESGKKDASDPGSPDGNPAFPFPKEPTMKSVPHSASDPFSEVVISGIVYSDKNPMALLSVASLGPTGPGNDGGNKIVKKGDRVQVSYG
ncbi:MAG: hypothetical protein K2X66_11925, partial [Cyanobacteria bacterium]|nr:hypothetical protein [Cyanobacteriota bacterium]